jgi:signal peptidase II
LILGVAALAILVDQLTKWWALRHWQDHPVHVVGSLHLDVTRNTGAAFSLAFGRGALVGVLALVVVGVVVWQGSGVADRLGAVAVGLVLGGALGNLADRAFRAGSGFLGGAVVDFIDLRWWPVFNVADSCVVVGAILLVVSTLFRPVADEPTSDAPTSDEPG